MINLLAVFIGGGLGCLVRFGISNITMLYFNTNFPVATLLSNVASCIIFGAAFFFFPEKMAENSTFRLLLVTGFCGGFSTFSAFSYETVELLRTGNVFYAVANIVISMVICFSVLYFLASQKAFR